MSYSAIRIGILFLLTVSVARAQQTVAESAPAVTAEKLMVTSAGTAATSDTQVVAGKDYSIKRAYQDVFEILAAQNTCSDFYGGSRLATTVLKQLVGNVVHGSLPDFVSFQMTGHPREFRDPASGGVYRLFDRAIINPDGAFYLRRISLSQRLPRNVGTFLPGTRPARALILLHELGHLIKGSDGQWLLMNDGTDTWKSKENTARIERACGAQLQVLAK
jgi:hypothetical protein